MLDLYLPISLKQKVHLISFGIDDITLINKAFPEAIIKHFKNDFFEGYKISLQSYDADLLRYANGAFGYKYFYDYDVSEFSIFTFGRAFTDTKEHKSNLKNIEAEIYAIKNELSSNKLLTNSKKEELREKIEDIFFSLSGVYFTLQILLDKTIENIEDLQSIDGGSDYEAQGELLAETAKTKKIELESEITSLEGRISLFIDTISEVFLGK